MDRSGGLACAVAACAVLAPVHAACTPRTSTPAADSGLPASAADASASPTDCTYPITSRDRRGRDVTLKAAPKRIVALLPSHTETLFALGVGAAVVGVDDYSAGIPGAEALPRLGGLYDAHVESILALQPDLALISDTSPAAAPLERAGVPTWGGSATRFDEIPRVIESLAAMLCRQAEGARLVRRIADDVAAVEKEASGRRRVRVYYELDASLYTIGPRSFIGTLIDKAGGVDVVPNNLGDFPKVSPETVIAADPEVIFGATLDQIRVRPGWAKITAVQSGHVYALDPEQGGLVSRPGPRIAEGLRVLFERIHPEAAR